MPRRLALGLDLMDTLIVDPYRTAVLEATGVPHHALRDEIDPSAWVQFELGRIDEAEYGRRFFRDPRRQLDMASFRRALHRDYRFVDGMEELVLTYRTRLELHVLSNYPSWYADVTSQFTFERFVSGHHPSYDVAARKPDACYFERVLARTELAIDQLLFVDDREENIRGAEAVGITAVHFRDASSLAEKIESWLATHEQAEGVER